MLEQNKDAGCSYNFLVKAGLLTPKELYTVVQLQIRDIIYSIFNMDKGAFFFKDKDVSHQN